MSGAQASKNQFKVGDHIVYPSHGVGTITGEETQVIAGNEMHVYIIAFPKDKMTLRIPKSRTIKDGLRHLSSGNDLNKVMEILRGKAKLKKGMWSKRATEYVTKINSGNILEIAEVLRDLHKNVDDPERSYSEKGIYDLAMDRLINEYSVSMSIDRAKAEEKILSVMNYMKED